MIYPDLSRLAGDTVQDVGILPVCVGGTTGVGAGASSARGIHLPSVFNLSISHFRFRTCPVESESEIWE
jgi:hypothetical protein